MTAASREVILCDESGRPQGACDLLAAHSGAGRLHLAFSVYLFSPDRRALLIQRRSAAKMLWPLVWANTCCSHPRAGENALDAGRRRLREEMGIDAELTRGPAFVYRAEDPAGRGVEHEYDVILLGTFAGDPVPNPDEVAAWRWVDVEQLRTEMRERPEGYAPWLHLGLKRLKSD
jgi:isopentenyl-diphosphate delta-isomerase